MITTPPAPIKNLRLSLVDMLGEDYLKSVCQAKAFLSDSEFEAAWHIAQEKVDFFPPEFAQRLNDRIDSIGERVSEPLLTSLPGAGTNSFNKANIPANAPLSGAGFLRIGEDGRLHLVSKSEHYHASLGHAFPGYRLVDNARRLGIPNATHNNTRGHITRLLEQELVRTANSIPRGENKRLQTILNSSEPHVLNRVLNLETGSLAVEAALKMMLTRFYRQDEKDSEPIYAGRTPVFLVIADGSGGKKANYHGTTLFTQFMRDLWPELYDQLERQHIFSVKPVAINEIGQFKKLVAEYDHPPFKIAGFFHEIILMNYGGIRLHSEFLQRAYAICHEHDIPTMVDEIQSCIWSPEFFLFKEYGLHPDFVSVGKGFPGGEYPASRILTTAVMDNLSQFGALVTNGQEELASLSYLVTMAFVQANQDTIQETGEYYQAHLNRLAQGYPQWIAQIEGLRHMSTIFFHEAEPALRFIGHLNQAGIDISAQTYKADCPPAALTKIPLVATIPMINYLINQMEAALKLL